MTTLAGRIRVLELSTGTAVPLAARIFADLGADVLRVERSGGDPLRSHATVPLEVLGDGEEGIAFQYLNTGKRSVVLDLATEEGSRIFDGLLAWASIAFVDESYASNCRERLDRAVAEDGLSVVYLTPYGLTGPNAGYSAVPASTFAGAGESSMLPGGIGYDLFPNRPPLVAAGNVADYDSAIVAVACAAAALVRAVGSDAASGATVDISRQEAEASLNRWLVSHYDNSGWIETRSTRAYDFGGLTECADGWVMFQTTTDQHFLALLEMMGSPDWATGEAFSTREGRKGQGAVINEHLRPWARERTKAELLHLALQYECPIGPFWTAEEIHQAEHFRQRGFFAPYQHPSAGEVSWPRLAFNISGVELAPLSPPPRPGQHNDEVQSLVADVGG